MAKLKCKCGNTYLSKISVNQFTDYPGNLHSLLQEVDPDFDIRMYQCIKCSKYILPPVDYYATDEAMKDLYKDLIEITEGREPIPKKEKRQETIHPGYIGKANPEKNDLSNHGQFVRQR